MLSASGRLSRFLAPQHQVMRTCLLLLPSNRYYKPCLCAQEGMCKRFFTTSSSSVGSSSDARTSRVGFIGLGNMGFPMALNLAHNKDVSVLAFDTNKAACDAIVQQGGRGNIEVADSISNLAAAAALNDDDVNVIFTMLPGCAAVNSVMTELLTSSELAKERRDTKPLCFVDCSTVSPTTSRHWHKLCSANDGFKFFDAPVSGGVKGATNGELTFMVGCCGEEDGGDIIILEQMVRPLLEIMGKRVILCGGPGAGAATKLCNNLALATQMVGICEAMNLGEALGVDPTILADVMNTSTAACWSSKVNNPHPKVAEAMKKSGSGEGPPASRDYEGGFGTKLMLKDLGLAATVAQERNVAIPLTTTSKELYRMAALRGLGDKDFGVILKFLRGE